jgi:hypothetical protein
MSNFIHANIVVATRTDQDRQEVLVGKPKRHRFGLMAFPMGRADFRADQRQAAAHTLHEATGAKLTPDKFRHAGRLTLLGGHSGVINILHTRAPELLDYQPQEAEHLAAEWHATEPAEMFYSNMAPDVPYWFGAITATRSFQAFMRYAGCRLERVDIIGQQRDSSYYERRHDLTRQPALV